MTTAALYNQAEQELRQEVQDFVAAIPRSLLLAMDAEEITYPREFLQEAGG
jgi:hypothetical protein